MTSSSKHDKDQTAGIMHVLGGIVKDNLEYLVTAGSLSKEDAQVILEQLEKRIGDFQRVYREVTAYLIREASHTAQDFKDAVREGRHVEDLEKEVQNLRLKVSLLSRELAEMNQKIEQLEKNNEVAIEKMIRPSEEEHMN